MRRQVLLAFLAGACVASPPGDRNPSRIEVADLVLRKGRIWTVDPTRPEAEAVAILGDRILAVGSDAEVLPFTGPRTQ
ncbi:MAG TPA: amidohydrolase, partial [Planctomycetota bacterium]|nr:amidohydrolase [Planctomycetota bacterium]